VGGSLIPWEAWSDGFGLAVSEGRVGVVKKLIMKWPIRPVGQTSIHGECDEKEIETEEVESWWNPDGVPNLLHLPARKGDLEMVKVLVQLGGFDPDGGILSPMFTAAIRETTTSHTNSNNNNTTTSIAPSSSSSSCSIASAYLFLQKESNISHHLQPSKQGQPLIQACRSSHEKIVAFFLSSPSVIYMTIDGSTIQAAAMGGSGRILRSLIYLHSEDFVQVAPSRAINSNNRTSFSSSLSSTSSSSLSSTVTSITDAISHMSTTNNIHANNVPPVKRKPWHHLMTHSVWEDCMISAAACGNSDIVNVLLSVREEGWNVSLNMWNRAVQGGYSHVARLLKAEMY
jgi:hypothetical protein